MQPRSQRQKETRGWSRISRLSKVDSGHAECSYGLQKFKQGLVLGATTFTGTARDMRLEQN
jgi:hypothetical protein